MPDSYGLEREILARMERQILEALDQGPQSREDLKSLCRSQGMTPDQEAKLFNAWGGFIRHLVWQGKIYQAYGQKVFHRLKDFVPMSQDQAELEIARRYFSGFGPVSLADARYHFKETKTKILSWMDQLDLKTIQMEGQERYYLGDLEEGQLPQCLFLAGFDQVLLGYEKRENPFFDPRYIRDIYTLTGIVKPLVFYQGRFVASWRWDKNQVVLTYFEDLKAKDQAKIENYRQAFESQGRA